MPQKILVLSVDLDGLTTPDMTTSEMITAFAAFVDTLVEQVKSGKYTDVVLKIAAKQQYFSDPMSSAVNEILFKYRQLDRKLKSVLDPTINYIFDSTLVADYYNFPTAPEPGICFGTAIGKANRFYPCPIDVSYVAPLCLHMQTTREKYPQAEHIDVKFYGKQIPEETKRFFKTNCELIPDAVHLTLLNETLTKDTKKRVYPKKIAIHEIFEAIGAQPEKECNVATHYHPAKEVDKKALKRTVTGVLKKYATITEDMKASHLPYQNEFLKNFKRWNVADEEEKNRFSAFLEKQYVAFSKIAKTEFSENKLLRKARENLKNLNLSNLKLSVVQVLQLYKNKFFKKRHFQVEKFLEAIKTLNLNEKSDRDKFILLLWRSYNGIENEDSLLKSLYKVCLTETLKYFNNGKIVDVQRQTSESLLYWITESSEGKLTEEIRRKIIILNQTAKAIYKKIDENITSKKLFSRKDKEFENKAYQLANMLDDWLFKITRFENISHDTLKSELEIFSSSQFLKEISNDLLRDWKKAEEKNNEIQSNDSLSYKAIDKKESVAMQQQKEIFNTFVDILQKQESVLNKPLPIGISDKIKVLNMENTEDRNKFRKIFGSYCQIFQGMMLKKAKRERTVSAKTIRNAQEKFKNHASSAQNRLHNRTHFQELIISVLGSYKSSVNRLGQHGTRDPQVDGFLSQISNLNVENDSNWHQFLFILWQQYHSIQDKRSLLKRLYEICLTETFKQCEAKTIQLKKTTGDFNAYFHAVNSENSAELYEKNQFFSRYTLRIYREIDNMLTSNRAHASEEIDAAYHLIQRINGLIFTDAKNAGKQEIEKKDNLFEWTMDVKYPALHKILKDLKEEWGFIQTKQAIIEATNAYKNNPTIESKESMRERAKELMRQVFEAYKPIVGNRALQLDMFINQIKVLDVKDETNWHKFLLILWYQSQCIQDNHSLLKQACSHCLDVILNKFRVSDRADYFRREMNSQLNQQAQILMTHYLVDIYRVVDRVCVSGKNDEIAQEIIKRSAELIEHVSRVLYTVDKIDNTAEAIFSLLKIDSTANFPAPLQTAADNFKKRFATFLQQSQESNPSIAPRL